MCIGSSELVDRALMLWKPYLAEAAARTDKTKPLSKQLKAAEDALVCGAVLPHSNPASTVLVRAGPGFTPRIPEMGDRRDDFLVR